MPEISEKGPPHTDRRHLDILRRTRMGIQEDLEDLRDELIEHLDEFESRLRRTSFHLPRWLNLPENALRESFQLKHPPSLQGTLIGPRSVAMVASDVEDFLILWLGEAAEDFPAWEVRDDSDTRERLQQDLNSLHTIITETIESVSLLADEGPFALEQLLESIVFELETRRESDVEALENLIHGGDINAGRAAQAEIAELWEEQRTRVNQLQRVWDDILAIHHDGITRTLRGLHELKELSERTEDGLRGAGLLGEGDSSTTTLLPGSESNRFLRSPSEISEVFGSVDAKAETSNQARSTHITGDQADKPSRPFTNQAPSRAVTPPSDAANHRATTSTKAEQIELALPGPTAPMNLMAPLLDASQDTPTLPMGLTADLPAPASHEASSTEASATAAPRQKHETFPPHEAAPPITDHQDSPGEQALLDSPPVAKTETKADPKTENTSASSLPDQTPPASKSPTAQTLPDEEIDPEAGQGTSDEENEILRLRSYRLRDGWQVVPPGDIIASLCPPALLVGAFFVLSALSSFGLAENPMTRWEWAFPATLAAMALLLVIPLLLRWRPMWRGKRFSVLRRGAIEDEVNLRLTDSKLFFDRTPWPIDDLNTSELLRWEAPDEDLCGWVLTLVPPYHSPVKLATFVDLGDPTWEEDPTPLGEIPQEAWQIPADEFHRLQVYLRD